MWYISKIFMTFFCKMCFVKMVTISNCIFPVFYDILFKYLSHSYFYMYVVLNLVIDTLYLNTH